MIYDKVIFACMDNTCRSIMAEAVMNSVNKKGQIEVASRGLAVLFPEPINPRAVAILKSNGLEPQKESSEQLSHAELEPGTLVLVMNAREKKKATDLFKNYSEIYTIAEYTEQGSDIDEPHGDLSDYGACYEFVDFMVKMAAEKLFKQAQN